METKEQVYEVILLTTDEELDGENWIDNAIREYLKNNKQEHVSNIRVAIIRNEWAD